MNKNDRKQNHRLSMPFEHWQLIAAFLIIYDFVAVVASWFLALWLRFDGRFAAIPAQYFLPYKRFILPYALFCILVFAFFRMYRGMWRFASFVELERTFLASFFTSLVHILAITLIFARMPLSYYVLGSFFQFVFLIAVRFSYRFVQLLRSRVSRKPAQNTENVMLIGAGSAGQMILRDIQQSDRTDDRVV